MLSRHFVFRPATSRLEFKPTILMGLRYKSSVDITEPMLKVKLAYSKDEAGISGWKTGLKLVENIASYQGAPYTDR